LLSAPGARLAGLRGAGRTGKSAGLEARESVRRQRLWIDRRLWPTRIPRSSDPFESFDRVKHRRRLRERVNQGSRQISLHSQGFMCGMLDPTDDRRRSWPRRSAAGQGARYGGPSDIENVAGADRQLRKNVPNDRSSTQWARSRLNLDPWPSGPRPYFLGGSSSGRTTDSDSVNLGSNPSPPAIRRKRAGLRAGSLAFARRAGGFRHDRVVRNIS
jgi:hypothetical protein